MRRVILACALAAGTGAIHAPPALADATLGGKTVECYCTDSQGKRIELGEMICLHVDGKSFIAQCQMSLNVPMWRKISDGCLSSSLRQLPQPAVDALGVHAQI
ncbi:MAG: hypothetical protein Kow0058_15420 [Roseovarius sp.]